MPSEKDKETTRCYRKKYIFASMSNRWNWQVFEKPSNTNHKEVTTKGEDVSNNNYLIHNIVFGYLSNSSRLSR
jgi:hypothetical protein